MKKNTLALIILAGVLLRVICGYFVYGFIGFDEYYNGIDPAGIKLFLDHSFVYSDVARSPLLFYLDYGLFFIASKVFSIESPVNILRFAMIIMGLISSVTIYLSYRIAILLDAGEKTALFTAALISFYFAMPFLQTRLMVESISSLFIIISVYFFADRKFFMSALVLGIASMFRFHVGVIYIALLFVMIFSPSLRKGSGGFILGGSLALLIQLMIDYFHSGGVLSSVIEYTRFQSGVFLTHSRQPWYNFLLLFIGLSVPIASIVTLTSLFRAGVKYYWLGIIFIIFVVLHSLSPHKEDRFMFPVIPLFLIMTGLGMNGLKNIFIKRNILWLYSVSIYWFWVVNTVLLFLACTSPTMTNVSGALDYVRTNNFKTLASDSPIVPKFFTAYKGNIEVVQKDGWKKYLCSLNTSDGNYIHTIYDPLDVGIESSAKTCGVELNYIGNFKSGYMDRILAKLNPKYNYRRANGHLYLVSKPKRSS